MDHDDKGQVYRIFKIYAPGSAGLVVVGIAAFAALWNLLLGDRPVELRSSGVVTWWTVLCVVGVFNVFAWQRTAVLVTRWSAGADAFIWRFQRWQLLLSSVFVLGCAFRSLFPRADVQRIGLIDSWLSSVLVGRSVATVAELCFMAQWALLLHGAAKEIGSRFAVAISLVIVPLIAVAEVCSWTAVLTTCYIGNVVEESIWALCGSLLVIGCIVVWSHCRAARRPFLAAALVLGTMYVTFMCAVDIPMYLSRWQSDEAAGRAYLTLGQGLDDAWSRRIVTFSWEEWRTEVPWMSLYFSVCVWWSLALVYAPRLTRHPKCT
jgi:hypothetical protein